MRRRLAALSVTAFLLAGVVGCGNEDSSKADDDSSKSSTSEPDPDVVAGVTVTGDFGKQPKVTVKDLDVDEAVDGVVIEGDGPEVRDDSLLEFWSYIVYGSNGEEVANGYTAETTQQLKLTDQSPAIAEALIGTKVGSRIVVALPVEDLLGKGQASQMGLKPTDDLVMVMDLVSEVDKPLDGPDGEAVDPPADAPEVIEQDGVVSGIDFGSAPAEPASELQVIKLVEGSGDAVNEGDSVTVDYFGTVYGEGKAFDESYSGEPATFTLAQGSLIDGWVQGLDGVTVGSRVLLVIPSELGYGAEGSGESIPPDSTLVFVIDVLAAN